MHATHTDDHACTPCAHAALHGWWGPCLAPARSHCRECHRSWASLREGHCTRCHAHFADTRAFDHHLVGDDCADPETLRREDGRPRLAAKDRGYGIVWGVVDYRTHTRPYLASPALPLAS